jgi:cytochrome P450
MKTIGLCMIVKNEANVITRCLDSARPLIDYVLVEDTGSTDGTQDIVRKWLDRNNIPGLVIEEPWQDFAYNRSHALETLRQVETVDYAGVIDPDNQLVLEAGFDPVAFKEEMQHDVYHVQIRHGAYHWRLPYLFANHLPFRFIGVLHETLKPPTTELRETIAEGFYVQTGREGWRNNNPRKYQDDAALLEKALLTETDPFLIARYTFYLAQSYSDCGEREKALTNYLKRAQQGLWQEEIGWSLFQAGILQESLRFPPEQVLATLLRASDASLDRRAEPLHQAARYCRSLGRYEEGYQYAKRGTPMKKPESGMGVINWIYDYGVLEELARNAFLAGRPQESLKVCQRLLREGKVPAELRTDVIKIADFAAGIVAGFYHVPNYNRLDSDKYRNDSEVLEEVLSAEDDTFLRARYTFYLALCHQNEGERGKALVASEEAVRLYRELPGRDADASMLGFAAALDNLSHRLSDFDRHEEALAASEEAVRLYREWSSSTPNALLPERASALDNLARQLSHFDRHEEALAASEEARTIQSRPMQATILPSRPLLDFSDPRFKADPYPVYRRLRERAPIWRSPWGDWVLTRHADIVEVLRNPNFGHDYEEKLSRPYRRPPILEEPAYRFMALMMLVRDPPDHTRLRALVAPAFTARRIEAMRTRIETRVDTLLDAIIPRRRMEVMNDFARVLPITVICDILGIPEQDRSGLQQEYRFSGRTLDPTLKRPEEVAEDNANALCIRAIFEDIFKRRERELGDDIISVLLQARDDVSEGLSHDELAANLALMFEAGHATSAYLIGNGLLALQRHPLQWELLKARPQLASNAVEELLRFESSIQLTTRKAFKDAALPDGTVIRRGERAICMVGAGNRDPDVYADPDRLDITRAGVRPLSFGGGIHHCLGAQLARVEGEVVFRRLAQRLPGLVVEDLEHPQWLPTITMRGLTQLDARW